MLWQGRSVHEEGTHWRALLCGPLCSLTAVIVLLRHCHFCYCPLDCVHFCPPLSQGYWEPYPQAGGGITAGGQLQLLAFCGFEACVGAFWPSIMRMRAQHIPEDSRATILTMFRIPLNLFVCVVLYNVSEGHTALLGLTPLSTL